MDRGAAMLAVGLDVYEGGKDLIPGWTLKEHAENAFATGGVEGLRRYYEACLTGSGHRVKTTLERDRRKTLESRSEEHTSELQSLAYLVCRLLLEKKKKTIRNTISTNHDTAEGKTLSYDIIRLRHTRKHHTTSLVTQYMHTTPSLRTILS